MHIACAWHHCLQIVIIDAHIVIVIFLGVDSQASQGDLPTWA